MEKRIIFGLDRTPRKELWAKIEEQNRIIESLKAEHSSCVRSNAELMRGLKIALEASNQSLRDAEITIEGQRKKMYSLQNKLDRYKRARGSNGRFVKK